MLKANTSLNLKYGAVLKKALNAVIVNPSIILGPGKWDVGSAALFGRVANGFKYYTEGVNAYVDARDVAKAMHLLMESNITAKRYVLVSENKTYRDVFKMIAEQLGAKAPSIHAKPWMGEIVWRLEVLRSAVIWRKAYGNQRNCPYGTSNELLR